MDYSRESRDLFVIKAQTKKSVAEINETKTAE